MARGKAVAPKTGWRTQNITSETETTQLQTTGPSRRHHGEVDGEGRGWHQDASKESVDSCNRATGTRHGTQE